MSLVSTARQLVEGAVRRLTPRYRLNYRNRGRINLIDVGSVGGLPEPWRSNADKVRFLLNFEPNEAPRRSRDSATCNTAVWESEAVLPFYIYRGLDATGSSLFRQNFRYVQENYAQLSQRGPAELASTWFERSELVRTTELKCRALDDILREEFGAIPFHFVKIDAQGAEYNILKGARDLLAGSCVGLHLELFTVPLYEGIVLMDDVVQYLSTCGFQLARIYPPHGTFDSQHDCIFLKDSGDPALLATIRRVYALDVQPA